MKAVHVYARGQLESLAYEDAPAPEPAEGEALIRVHAAAVTAAEIGWRGVWKAGDGQDRVPPIIPGHEFSGVVAEVGRGVTGLDTGTAVYGLLGFARDGAQAEYAIALPGELAPMPRSLDFPHAASVPLGALTAWQALFEHAALSPGQSVLVHGAAGWVGAYGIQIAHWAGAHVTGTASSRHAEYVRDLGADQVIDYRVTRFEDVVRDVDVVLDTVGGDTLDRSYAVVRRGGTLVSVARPTSSEQAAAHEIRATFFIVEPDGAVLERIGQLIDDGVMRAKVDAVLPLSQAFEAYERSMNEHGQGKVVLQVVA